MASKSTFQERFEQGVRRVRLCLAGNYSKGQFSMLKDLMGKDAARIIDGQVGRSCWEEIDRVRLMCMAFLVKDSNVMLLGPYGAGKTYSVGLASEIFGQEVFRVQGSVNTDPSNFSGQVNVSKLTAENKFELIFPGYAVNGGKPSVLFVDEINRMAPHEMNYMTAILAERKLDSEAKHALDGVGQPNLNVSADKMVAVEGLTVFATRNRHDSATFEMPYHNVDRFSLSLLFELDNIGTLQAKSNCNAMKARMRTLELFTPEEVTALRENVARIPVKTSTVAFLDAFVKQFSHCGEYGSQKEFVSNDPCTSCPRNGQLCSCLEQDFYLSGRSKEQILAFAKAEAFIQGARTVEIEHTIPVLFPALAHRLRLKPTAPAMVLANSEIRSHLPSTTGTAGTVPYYDAAYGLVRVAVAEAVRMANELSSKSSEIRRDLTKFDSALSEYVFVKLTNGKAWSPKVLFSSDLVEGQGFGKTVEARYLVNEISQRLAAAEEILSEFPNYSTSEEIEKNLSATGMSFYRNMVKQTGKDPYLARNKEPESVEDVEDYERCEAMGMGR